MAKAVVLTPGAATGIEAKDDVHFAVARPEAPEMLRRIATLLADEGTRAEMGRAARDFVLANMSWNSVHIELERLLVSGDTGRDAA